MRTPPGPSRALGRAAPALLPALLLLGLGYRRRWVTEDAFISFRVVEHLLAGDGPVFNLGERVEAFTHPLWVGLLALGAWLGMPLERGSVWLGLVLSAAGLAAAGLAAATLRRADLAAGAGAIALPVGGLVFVAPAVVWDFATSGLETGLAVAWLGGSYLLLARATLPPGAPPAAGRAAAAVAVGLGPLVRPDLALVALPLLAALVLLATRGLPARRAAARGLFLGALALALPAGYQAFRMGYYAALVPNTALAKEASLARWDQGARYAWDFVGTYALWLPLLVLLAWWAADLAAAWPRADRGTRAVWCAPVAGALAHALYVMRVGGDFMHGRFLLPTLLALVLPVAAVAVRVEGGPARWARRPRGGAAGLATLVLAGWAAACGGAMRSSDLWVASPAGIIDERAYYVLTTRHRNPVTLADYLDLRDRWATTGLGLRDLAAGAPRTLIVEDVALPLRRTAPPAIAVAAAVGNVGVLGYAAGRTVAVIDRLALADPIGARLRLDARGRPGHEKRLAAAWVLARWAEPRDGEPEEVAAARQALGCGDLAGLRRAVEEPLTPGRFLGNLAWSVRLTALRVPADPAAARREACGRGPGP